MTLRRNYIAGEWADGVGTAQNINTSDTRDVVGTYARAGHAAAEQAIAGAF
jgi:acyl-CoA reductase-like NAD-dependent aldehyde dehydrogenase